MNIVVDHIKDKPLAIHIDEPVETFPLLAGMQNDKSCSIAGRIQGDITVTREYENIRVTGRVTVPLALPVPVVSQISLHLLTPASQSFIGKRPQLPPQPKMSLSSAKWICFLLRTPATKLI